MAESPQDEVVYSSRYLHLWRTLWDWLLFLLQLFVQILRTVGHLPLLSSSPTFHSFKSLPVVELLETADHPETVEISEGNESGEKENLCLYGHPDETWEVNLPAEEVPPELPEPALGINFARDGMQRRDWLSLVAVHSDCWLLSVAFYFGARLNRNERKKLFGLMNDLPTLFEVVTGRKPPAKDKVAVDTSNKPRGATKRSIDGEARNNVSYPEESYEEDEDEHGDTLCGSCGGSYNADEFWIGCDVCERWYHGKCVKITPAKAESIKQYKCPSCSTKKGR